MNIVKDYVTIHLQLINESKTLTKNIYHVNITVILMVKNVTRIKSVIKNNVGARAKIQKNIIRAKRIAFGILLHALVKM